MCSNAGRSGPPMRPEADLAARLAAAIDELAAVVSGSARAAVDTERNRAQEDSGTESPSAQDLAAGNTATTRTRAEHDLTEHDLVERLARAWAMITAADPEVAARTAHYSGPGEAPGDGTARGHLPCRCKWPGHSKCQPACKR